MKTAFVFSGQGSQYYNMGKELYANYEIVKNTILEADSVLDFEIEELCFKENKKLHATEYTQPILLAFSIAFFRLLKQNNITADYYAGLSLGEYSALTAANAFEFKDAVKLVRKRGQFMQDAAPFGGMTAVMNAEREIVEGVCREASEYGIVAPANYNMPGQIVIAGEIKALEAAENIFKQRGIKRLIRLKVSGPFHTSLLNEASEKLNTELKKISIQKIDTPVITNLTAQEIGGDIAESLVKQIVSPVYWEDSINYLIEKGVRRFVEVGPGKVLSGFIKKINKEVEIFNVEDEDTLRKILDERK